MRLRHRTSWRPPFQIGDKVFSIVKQSLTVRDPCAMCEGSGRITVNDISALCPLCYGRGDNSRTTSDIWRVSPHWSEGRHCHLPGYLTFTIGMLRGEKRDRWEDCHRDPYVPNGIRWEAMCYETGVGSGTNYPCENLFLSLEQAEKECERRNQLEALNGDC